MATAVKTVPGVEYIPSDRLYRLTVEQYHHMIEAGVLVEGAPVELLEGLLLTKMTKNPSHDVALDLTREALEELLPSGWRVRVQSAITTADSEPEPDLAVVVGPARRYLKAHPRPKEIALLVEVADASLFEDRGRKARIYARARIPVYWIVNVKESKVEVYTDPKGGKSPAYSQQHDYGIGESVPLIIEGEEIGRIPVKELLP
ncbi:MAG TPA: Uma2 family endonuclease [Gemmataceae bacterium]|jgi:Uma2 family endonuclease|nr:Uma2 family endonuclease [Gemmataceae bacterium]